MTGAAQDNEQATAPESFIALGLSVLEAGGLDVEPLDVGGKPLFIQATVTRAEAARIAALAGRWSVSKSVVLRLAVSAAMTWAEVSEA